jgi:hypothetical protein
MKLPLLLTTVAIVTFASSFAHSQSTQPSPAVTRVPVVFSGGHDTDPQDRGRPVVLVAAALGVAPEVFRDAFRQVHPAPAGTQPDPQQVRANKAALMAALGKYGVTDDRLNEVSNYYRYVRSRGELWPTKPAVAVALVQNGVVTRYEVTSGGSGYSSPPAVSVPGVNAAPAKVELSFGKSFDSNGAVSAIVVAADPAKAP